LHPLLLQPQPSAADEYGESSSQPDTTITHKVTFSSAIPFATMCNEWQRKAAAQTFNLISMIAAVFMAVMGSQLISSSFITAAITAAVSIMQQGQTRSSTRRDNA
jgi:hypothetical protein